MKTIIVFLAFAFFAIYCSNDTVTNSNNNPTPCTDSCSLLVPYNGMLADFRTIFKWSSATCDPDKYLFQVTNDSTFQTVLRDAELPHGTTEYQLDWGWANDSTVYYWRVKVIYNRSPIDTLFVPYNWFRYEN